MNCAAEDFDRLVRAVLDRFFRQNGQAPLPAEIAGGFSARLWALVGERGLPPPLAPGDPGAPRDWPAAEVAPLVARVLSPDTEGGALLATAARQLVKACFQPEFRTCRESYREREADGSCRRQQLARVRERVSGAHCADCPYWTVLDAERHGRLLRRAWAGDPAELDARRDVFLPEDFRALRRWLRERARRTAPDGA